MSIEDIELICGLKPIGFKKLIVTGSNYIFDVDPDFTPINLYNFWGNAATVNSFSECFHYVEGGYRPTFITVFDIAIGLLISATIIYSIYKFFKIRLHKNLFKKFKYIISKIKKENLYKYLNYLIVPLFFIQHYFLFDYVRSKSAQIPNFIDEYISLSSNVGFFKNFDFNAGDFIGGSYSIYLTSGPISAIGGVIGWNITSNLVVARISNFYWILFLQLLLSFVIIKVYKSDFKFLLFMNGFLLILVPWWQGSLYMIGEFASVFIFTNAMFLFSKYKYLSMFLFSISIFYGKLLTLLPFTFFYLILKTQNRKFKDTIYEVSIFSIPLFSWLLLVSIKYKNGNIFNYLTDLMSLVLGHQSVGIEETSITSEVVNWNNFETTRILFVPLLFIYIVTKNRKKIDKIFGDIALPIVGSVMAPYLWFWLLSPTKWMRYSQHFTIILIISLIYFMSFNIQFTKIDFFMLCASLAIYIDNEKNMILILLVIIFYILFLQQKYRYKSLVKVLIVLFIFLDISFPYFQKNSFGDLNNVINSCREQLVSSQCLEDYEND